jgi:uncharacterized protein (DUF302 family)
VSLPFAETVAAIREALAAEGFGVLTEIDMQATMKAKLDEDYPPLLILGACNPQFAHQAMGITEEIATLVPCNVVVRETPDGVTVAAVDPQVLVAATNPGLAPLADQLRAKLERALDSLAG